MKEIALALVFIILKGNSPMNAQEVVKVVQPAMYSYFYAGQQLTDTTSRYFLGSRESAYLSNDVTYIADYDIINTLDVSVQIPIDSNGGGIVGAYEFFHVPLQNGNAIIGTNVFDCDIAFTNLGYVTKNGDFRWLLLHYTEFNDFIDTIGFVAADVIAVIAENSHIYYFNLEGVEVFYQAPPTIYFNIIPHNGFYYGIKEEGVYKLSSQFDPIQMYPIHAPSTFHYAENGEFLVSTEFWSVLLNTDLDEVSINFSIANTLSIARTTDFLWIVTPQGLYQTTGSLVIQKHYSAEPFEKMIHAWAYQDTVYVGSEYNGIYHRDIVIRMYGPGINSSNPYDVSITSMYIDTVIRELGTGGFGQTLRFDSVMVEVHNQGVDTITSLFVNWDWRLYFGFCHSIYGELAFNDIVIPPGQFRELQFGPFVTDQFFEHIEPEFCFWVDSINGQPDVWPEDNRLCFETEIINHTLDLSPDYIFSVNPNPASNEITIEFSSEKFAEQLDIYTNLGVLVYTTPVSGNYLKVDIKDWYAGIYYILARRKDQFKYVSFVKQ